MKTFLAALASFAFLNCGSHSLRPDFKPQPGKGVVYGTLGSFNEKMFCDLHFEKAGEASENGTKQRKKSTVFTVNRAKLAKRDPLMVFELESGAWTLSKVQLMEQVGGDSYIYPMPRIPPVTLQVAEGKANYLAHIELTEDCKRRAISLRGTAAKCVDFSIEYLDRKDSTDRALAGRYQNLKAEADAGTAIQGGMPGRFAGKFGKPEIRTVIFMH